MAIPFTGPADEEEFERLRTLYLERLLLDIYRTLQHVLRIRNAQYQRNLARNPRVPRRSSESGAREQPMILVDSDLSRLPLPDLVLSAMEQLPGPPPQVTASAPSSPTRDATFQFPECSAGVLGSATSSVNVASPILPASISASAMMSSMSQDAPVPSPRPKPRRRRLTSEGSLPDKADVPSRFECSAAHNGTCCVHQIASLDEREWAQVGANLRNIADDFHASKTKDAEVEKSRLPFMSSGSNSSLTSSSGAGGPNSSGPTDGILSTLIPAPLRETLWTTLALYLGWRLVSRLR